MPTHFNPPIPSLHQHVAVEDEGAHSCSPTCGSPSENHPLISPLKMLAPHQQVWVVEPYKFTGQRIGGGNGLTLAEVTVLTGQAEVGEVAAPSKDFGDDMVDCKPHTQNGFLALTVGTAKAEMSRYFTAQGKRQSGFRHLGAKKRSIDC